MINEGTSKNRGKIYGYSLASDNRTKQKDIILPRENAHPSGMTGRDGRLYVIETTDAETLARIRT